MKTIAFYSYKGGVGRSLLAANLAVCLSRLGKNCALIDLDLDAPSLHNKIGAGEPSLGRGGIVKLIEDGIELKNKDWAEARFEDIEFRPIDDAKRYSVLLGAVRDRAAYEKREQYGRIHFIAAGDIYTEHYWDVVWSGLWRELFTMQNRYDVGKQSSANLEAVVGFLRHVKSRIAVLDDPTEYLIIDCRSGASDLTTTILSAWLDNPDTDKLVYVFGFNEDSIKYLDVMIRRTRFEMRDLMRLVLSRVPSSVEYRGDRQLLSTMAQLGVQWSDLSVLHSDRELEGQERLRLGLYAPPDNRLLTREYLALFEKLIDPSDCPGKSLAEKIGLTGEMEDEKERLFTLDSKAGALINPNDGSRNVAFKVETFHLLLQGLENGIANHGVDAHLSGSERHSDSVATQQHLNYVLLHAGIQCGQRFGESLSASYFNLPRMGPHEKIEKWCHFDSDVGFGRFELDLDSLNIKGRRLERCDVILYESFLTPASDIVLRTHGHRYCEFMRGYIIGVLTRLFNVPDDEFIVCHEAMPLSGSGRSESCRFQIWDKETRQENERHPAGVGQPV